MNSVSRMGGRQRLIDATLTSLAQRGYHRSTLKAIAETAGVTAGLVRHHFKSKDELMVAAYRHFVDTRADAYLSAADAAGPDPVKRLEAFTRSVLSLDTEGGERTRIWVNFLELAIMNSQVAAIRAVSHERYLREIGGCVTGIFAARGDRLSPEGAQRLASGINAIIDGVWLERSLNPHRMTPEEALTIALEMIGARLGVCFSSGRADT